MSNRETRFSEWYAVPSGLDEKFTFLVYNLLFRMGLFGVILITREADNGSEFRLASSSSFIDLASLAQRFTNLSAQRT